MPDLQVIGQFCGSYWFLSNFHPSWIEFEGKRYPTVEHAYQAAKSLNANYRDRVRFAMSPGRAKRMGQSVALRVDWEQIKLGVMLQLLRKKFAHPILRQQLLATGNTMLVEGNTWGDTYWGVCSGVGKNHLGKILMRVREELKKVTKGDD